MRKFGYPNYGDVVPSALVIDPDAQLRGALRRLLSSPQLRVELASNTEEPMPLAGPGRSIDVVICEHHLSGAKGFDFLTALGASHPRIGRVLYTADHLFAATVQSAPFAVLVKPVPGQVLKQVVYRLLARGEEPAFW